MLFQLLSARRDTILHNFAKPIFKIISLADSVWLNLQVIRV